MQHPSIWEKLRAFIHRKTAPKPVNLPTLPNQHGPYTPTLGLLALAGIGWHIKTNPTYFNIYAYGGIALFVILPLTMLALKQWRKQEEELTKQRREKHAQEMADYAEARALVIANREETRREKIRNQQEAETIREKQKIRRRRGALRNFYSFLFGEDT